MKFRQALVWCLTRLLGLDIIYVHTDDHVLLVIGWIVGRNTH